MTPRADSDRPSPPPLPLGLPRRLAVTIKDDDDDDDSDVGDMFEEMFEIVYEDGEGEEGDVDMEQEDVVHFRPGAPPRRFRRPRSHDADPDGDSLPDTDELEVMSVLDMGESSGPTYFPLLLV